MIFECPTCDNAVVLLFDVGVPLSLIHPICPHCTVEMEYITGVTGKEINLCKS